MVDDMSLAPDSRSPAWMSATQRILGRLDDRALTIIRERIFNLGRSVPTLQDLGDRFGLSRERVRQIESAALKHLSSEASTSSEVEETVGIIRSDLGLVFSRAALADALRCSLAPGDLPDEVKLLLFLAGPFRATGETLVSASFDHALTAAVGHLDVGPKPLADVRKSMRELGIGEEHQLIALEGRRNVRIVNDMVVRWDGTIGDKAAVVLAVERRLMTADEIHEYIGEGSLTTLKNYLGGEDRFQRRGPRRWGLSEWGGEEYKSIAAEMVDELAALDDGMPIERLKRILDEKFGIVAASVEIMSVTHPTFVRDGAWVRLRHDGEPYVPDAALEEARDCVLIEGAWAWRHVVTRDTLRGSGHIVPEAFAAMLRLFPLGRFEVASDVGAIPMYWPSQSPGIGSLRRVAESLGVSEGDLLFVIADDSRHVSFRLVRKSDLDTSEPDVELLLRLGQVHAAAAWLPRCASAIGLPPHAQADEVEDLLEVRGDRQVLRLFLAARRGGQEV